MVTWKIKSENIYFEGEKSVALEEQIKTYMERSKLASGNDEPISECKQLSSDDSDLNEAVLNLSNVCDDGPSESDENSASNSKNYIAKNSVINQDKRGEDIVYKRNVQSTQIHLMQDKLEINVVREKTVFYRNT